jgi:hypothetical protein
MERPRNGKASDTFYSIVFRYFDVKDFNRADDDSGY